MTVLVTLWCVPVLLALAVMAGKLARKPTATTLLYTATACVSLVLCACGLAGMFAAHPDALRLPLGLPQVGANFRMDPLSALFLLIVAFGSALASVYAIGYGRHETSPERVLPFFPAFLAGMTLVVIADDAFTFLLSWEFMSLASWALVMAHHRESGNARAGYVYILMASFGTLALLLAFGLLAGPAGQYGFEAIRAHPAAPSAAALVLLLTLTGTGSKAGLVPLHVWLPLAHPAAPSHVSALMSGVMTKVAIYAFVRIVFDLLGPPAWWWGIVVLTLGGATAVMGVLYAMFQTDLKRVLAYSTIENVGFIFVGLGLSLAFEADQFAVAAVLALSAALFHALNHSLFKSLLFFGAGAVLSATGERDMEKLGGLIHRMPATALAMLGASAAISALPPFNGFASEWLTFQAILLSPELPQWGLKLLVPAVGALLALSVAFAAACFVRVYGIVFLGRPRSPAASGAAETDRTSLAVLFVLAAACLIAGIVPGYFLDAFGPVVQGLLGGHMPKQSAMPWLSLVPISKDRSSYNGLLVFLFIVASASLAAYAIHHLASKATRKAPAWDCGFPDSNPLTQYTAGSFAQPIRRVFATLVFRAREQVDMPPPGEVRPARFDVRLNDVVWETVYAPITGLIGFAADRLNVLQFLTIRRYLSLVFVALIALLMVVAIWR